MPIALKLKSFLDRNHVNYHVLKHHKTYTSQEIAEALHIPGKELAKVVILKTRGKFIMAVLPAHYKVDLVEMTNTLATDDLQMAAEQEFAGRFPDCEIGSMPPFGNLYGMDVYVDETLTEDEEIVFEAGNHTEAIKIAYRDFERLVQPQIGQFGRLSTKAEAN